MPSDISTLSFIADPTGSIEVIRADDPRNLDLGATQPIEVQMDRYLTHATDND